MFFIVSGRFHVKERNVDLQTGEVFGELGLLNSDQARTATIECTASGELLQISYEQVKLLYVQDPKFGFYFLHLVSKRLFHNLSLGSTVRPASIRGSDQEPAFSALSISARNTVLMFSAVTGPTSL